MVSRQPKKRIRVLLVYTVPGFLRMFRSVLSREEGLELLGRATGGAKALKQIEVLHPDVLVSCVRVRGLADFIRRARRIVPGIGVVLVNVFEEKEASEVIRSCGADVFVPMDRAEGELGKAIRRLGPA